MAPGETAYDIADREYDEAIRELNDAQNVTISFEDIEFYMRQDARIMDQASLQVVHQQNKIQRIIQHLFPNQPQVYSREYQQQQNNVLMDFLSPPH